MARRSSIYLASLCVCVVCDYSFIYIYIYIFFHTVCENILLFMLAPAIIYMHDTQRDFFILTECIYRNDWDDNVVCRSCIDKDVS